MQRSQAQAHWQLAQVAAVRLHLHLKAPALLRQPHRAAGQRVLRWLVLALSLLTLADRAAHRPRSLALARWHRQRSARGQQQPRWTARARSMPHQIARARSPPHSTVRVFWLLLPAARARPLRHWTATALWSSPPSARGL